ncbi:MAG TPA: asparagine synthase-related protein [Alphaproteobacteria bacterium]|nr:asparagine synthase-related protein [Alphaproteobacteria bacterium]
MPNLVGIWSPESPEESIRQTLSKQLHRVRVPNIAYAEYRSVHPGFGMGLQDHGLLENGPQPAQTPDGRFQLLLDGELYNAGELQRRFRHELPSQALSVPDLCLQLIVKHGPEIVHHFNGLFCLALYDRHSRRVTLISDRFGFRPLFYVRRAKAVIFGSELKALCAADPEPRKIDSIGTLEYFCAGSQIQDRTWLEGYLRLPPATILSVDEDGVQTRTYWTYKYDEQAPTLDQATYATVFATLLDRAVERCMQGSHRIGLFLSGGYDSRSVAASIRPYHLPLPAFTFGYAESRDVRYAAMLAERLGLDHYPLTDREPYLTRHCRAIVWRSEGLTSFANTTSMRYHTVMKDKMDVILTGFLAEFSGSHTWPRLLLARTRQETMNTVFERMFEAHLNTVRRLFSPSFFAQAFEGLREEFARSFAVVQNDHPLNAADCWNLIQYQPRVTFQTPCVDRHLFEIRAPHMDGELVEFLLSIPPLARLEQRIYKKMIAYRFPQIRDVPCTNSGLPINPKFASAYAGLALRYLSRKVGTPIAHMVGRRPALGREFRSLAEDFRAEPELARDVLQPLLKTGIFPAAMFNGRGIEELVAEHYAGKDDHETFLSRLISWGLAAQYFFHDDLGDVPTEMYVP